MAEEEITYNTFLRDLIKKLKNEFRLVMTKPDITGDSDGIAIFESIDGKTEIKVKLKITKI